MSQWLFPTTRWAIYLRDDLRCVYCDVTIQELLRGDGDNFLTIDHFRTRSKGGTNDPRNLLTCCYECNCSKGTLSLAAWCRDMGMKYTPMLSKVRRRRHRDVDQYRALARWLLGRDVAGRPPGPCDQMVEDHDWMVKRQWGEGSVDADHWDHLRQQASLFCATCEAPTSADGRHAPANWWDGAGPAPF